LQFQKQSTYYLQEAEWLHQNHKPCFEDHVNLSSMSSAMPLLCVCMMVGMGDAIPDEALEWAVGTPDAVVASAKIGRFMNDIAAYKVKISAFMANITLYHRAFGPW
jgi:(-)-germacrene D synthase